MEKRVFGCKEFSDVIFKTSLTLLEKILDFILEDQDITETYKFDKNTMTATAKTEGSN